MCTTYVTELCIAVHQWLAWVNAGSALTTAGAAAGGACCNVRAPAAPHHTQSAWSTDMLDMSCMAAKGPACWPGTKHACDNDGSPSEPGARHEASSATVSSPGSTAACLRQAIAAGFFA